MTGIASLAAQTLAQDTHLRRNPSPSDIAPSTAADSKVHVPSSSVEQQTPHHYRYPHADDIDDDDVHSISSSILDDDYQRPSRRPLPPLPDLRFEQSYLASIAPAHGVWWKIALITIKDQCLMPLLQGLGFNLALFGWRWWNRGVKFSGSGVGARVRRWWWGVNNWKLPEA